MANIISIGTALPTHKHPQQGILQFMQKSYGLNQSDARKLSFLYGRSGIENRYSVLEEFSNPQVPSHFGTKGSTCFSLDERMELFSNHALPLSLAAIDNCITGHVEAGEITHLITVSCTGMSAPGLDLEIMNALNLAANTFRTSINFMGCYGAVHGLKLAHMICSASPGANVLVVATELCTIHFQNEYSNDNAASSLLFSDGSAAVLVSNTIKTNRDLKLTSFYSHVSKQGLDDMSWKISNKGFLMTLSSYVPALIQNDISKLISDAVEHAGLNMDAITHWCFHPGGRKILDVIQKKLGLCDCAMSFSSNVLSSFGNMSSPTILFVLKDIMSKLNMEPANVLGVAFGPGLTMETFIASSHEF